MSTYFAIGTELTLREMLAEPIVQTMMTRDGVSAEQVEGLFTELRKSAFDQTRATNPVTSS